MPRPAAVPLKAALIPIRISLAVTPGALAVGAAVPTTAGAPSAGTHLAAGRGVADCAAAAVARASAPDMRAVDSRRRTVRRSMATLPGGGPERQAPALTARHCATGG